MIQQVFFNLLKNGAEAMAHERVIESKYNPEHHGKPSRFWVRVKSREDWVFVEIEDNGTGMEESIRKRVFEPFYTTKTVGTGTGLGMSLSYFIITRNHGGTMEVESQPGKGTRYIMRLPVHQV